MSSVFFFRTVVPHCNMSVVSWGAQTPVCVRLQTGLDVSPGFQRSVLEPTQPSKFLWPWSNVKGRCVQVERGTQLIFLAKHSHVFHITVHITKIQATLLSLFFILNHFIASFSAFLSLLVTCDFWETKNVTFISPALPAIRSPSDRARLKFSFPPPHSHSSDSTGLSVSCYPLPYSCWGIAEHIHSHSLHHGCFPAWRKDFPRRLYYIS